MSSTLAQVLNRQAPGITKKEQEAAEDALIIIDRDITKALEKYDDEESLTRLGVIRLAVHAGSSWPYDAVVQMGSNLQSGAIPTGIGSNNTAGALNGSTAPQGQPDPAAAVDPHEIQVRDQLLKAVAQESTVLLNGPEPIIDQFQANWPTIKNRLMHSDPGSFAPRPELEAEQRAHATTREELKGLKESIQRANGNEVEINSEKYVKLPTANANEEVTLDGVVYIKKAKHDEITNGWVKTLRGHVVAIRDSYNTKKSSIPKVDFTMTTKDATAHGDAVDALADFAKVKKTDKE